MITTAETYTRLLSDICCAKLLSRESLELMTTNQLHSVALDEMHGAVTEHPYGYGLGVRTLMTPEFARFKAPLREFGWGGAAGSYAVLDYERQLAVGYFQCVLNRPADAPNVYREIRNLAYECLGYTFGEE
jgi:CubicO group peptidase (beta-lactamase class C family)